MNNPEKIEKDAIKKLEEFLNSSKDKNEPMSTGTMLFEFYEGPRIDSLFKDVIDTTNMTQLIAEYKERVNNKTMGR